MSKKIEIRDSSKTTQNVLIEFVEILKQIKNGSQFKWAIIPTYEPTYVKDEAQSISKNIKSELSKNQIAYIDWDSLQILAEGVGQFIDLVLIGSKDPKKLKYYQVEKEMFSECDIVIIMFDTSWWEVSCKNKNQLDKFIKSFNEVTVVDLD